MRWFALVLALALVPVEATLYEATGSRTVTADVKADADSFVTITVLAPQLSLLNTYTAAAIQVTHKHVTGVTLSVTATKTAGVSYLVLTSASGTISAGETHTVNVLDDRVLHLLVTETITVRIDATANAGASNVGFATVTRDVVVTTL